MIRSLTLITLINIAYFLFQSFDIVTILDKFGFPIAVSIIMFIYFNRQIQKKDKDIDGYREQILAEQHEQTAHLKNLLKETKASNFCKFEK